MLFWLHHPNDHPAKPNKATCKIIAIEVHRPVILFKQDLNHKSKN